MVNSYKINFWDKIAYSYHKISLISKAHNEKYNRIAELILKNNIKKFLDIGCGSGILEKKLIEMGFSGEIIGIDNSKKMLEIAQKFLKKEGNIKFKLLDFTKPLPFNENHFDGVAAINVIFLLKNPSELIQNIKRVLKKDGLFFLVEPNPSSTLLHFFKNYFKKYLSFLSIKEIFYFLINLPHVLRIINAEKKMSELNKKRVIFYRKIDEIKELLLKNNFEILLIETIQLKQNFLFMAKNLK